MGFGIADSKKFFLAVTVFNLHAPTNINVQLSACYRQHKRVKKRAYEQRCREIEHGSFTPLIMSTTGGLRNEVTTFYKKLASLQASKWNQPYSNIIFLVTLPTLLFTPKIGSSVYLRSSFFLRPSHESFSGF